MDLRLDGKRALVTGSSAGIGAAVAKRLAHEGASVVVHGRDEARARAVAGTIASAGGRARVVIGDLGNDSGAEKVRDGALAAFGGIDILINNAGGYSAAEWFDTTPESWRRFYEEDVVSCVRMIQALAPGMRKAGWGRIINIASGIATAPGAVMADYAAAKAAMVNATVSLSKSLAGSGVGACTVSPGLILTEGVEKILRGAAKERNWSDEWNAIQARWFSEVLGSSSVKRLGTIDEVAHFVTFVASPVADYIVGANLRIDGGLTPSVN